MSDDRMWREWSQSAKQSVREKYPFHLEKFEQEVLTKIQREKRRRRWQVTSWAAGVAVAATLFFQIAQPFDGSLWGLTGAERGQEVFEWITPDEGFTHALKNGYPILPEVKLEKDGFVYQIRDAMVDHRRITFTLLISGEKMEEIARIPDESKRSDMLYGRLGVDLGELREIGGTSKDFQLIDGVHYLIIKSNYRIDEKKMREIMNQTKPVLPVQIVDMRKKEADEVVAELLLPLPRSVAAAEKVIEPDTEVEAVLETDSLLTRLKVNQIVASPTVMEAELEATLQDGFELYRLENVKLVDGKGKEYPAIDDRINENLERVRGGDATRVQGSDKYTMQFSPSLFFDDVPEKLELRFDEVSANKSIKENIVLDRNAKYPQSISFGKKNKLNIEKVYYDKGKLFIVIPNEGPEKINLRVEGQYYKDFIIAENLETVSLTFEVPKQEIYKVEMSGLEFERFPLDGVIPITK
ncbi:hypothetical protein [Brevibacillus brevis]|uniref:hypothetical protein n=1 Tax=Brevibacillus brevis TaxID=1393 RepID=UPI000D101039|nr:hypothetical protein [Brevibacillus brevis]PSJ65991.1 hypothetical protein C7J99_28470 [Brevibacillus brevis]RED27905.1 hypothetical protein DES34_109198 [Brevibacillus brevis]GEC88744.1 hypothetical protein BBR01nite_10750 [Brevibacillus brevis]VEF86943.1 Uncharacterised protein [Brevibacillus brevis]